jgi:hypothetical protein
MVSLFDLERGTMVESRNAKFYDENTILDMKGKHKLKSQH